MPEAVSGHAVTPPLAAHNCRERCRDRQRGVLRLSV